MAINPYQPPAPAEPHAAPSWSSRVALWLGGFEVFAGLALGLGGCGASLATDSSLAAVGALYFFAVGMTVLVAPGSALLGSRHWSRWLGQLLPMLLLAWLLAAWLSG